MATAKKVIGAPAESIADLRGTLDWLKSQGDLIETDKEVDPDLEIVALQKHPRRRMPNFVQERQG